MKSNFKTPCGRLVRGKECTQKGCHYSHKASVVRWWRENNSLKPCRHGTSCDHFAADVCLYYHPESHRSEGMGCRNELMMESLDETSGEVVDLTALRAEGPTYLLNEEDLSSFNKLRDDEIAIPGCPPQLTPLTESFTITLDSHNKDIRHFPSYTHAFEPLLRSVQHMRPRFDLFARCDVVTSAGSLRKLFHFLADDEAQKQRQRLFRERFDLEWRPGDATLVVSKWLGDPSYARSSGRGAGFERHTCRYPADLPADLRDSSASHHRVAYYELGGMRMAVQSEVDAFYTPPPPPPPPPPRSKPSSPAPSLSKEDKIAAGVGRLSLSEKPRRRDSGVFLSPHMTAAIPPSPPSRFALLALDDPGDSPTFNNGDADANSSPEPEPSPPPPPDIVYGANFKVHFPCGRPVPSDSLVEVKTHEAKNGGPMYAPEGQLYFGRRRKLYSASHHQGAFLPHDAVDVAHMDQGAALARWEREQQDVLGKLVALLRLVRGRMAAYEGGGGDDGGIRRASLVCDGTKGQEPCATLYMRNDEVRLLPGDV